MGQSQCIESTCRVPAGTRIHTRAGIPRVEEAVGAPIEVWTGSGWAPARVLPAGRDPVVRITLSDGSVLETAAMTLWPVVAPRDDDRSNSASPSESSTPLGGQPPSEGSPSRARLSPSSLVALTPGGSEDAPWASGFSLTTPGFGLPAVEIASRIQPGESLSHIQSAGGLQAASGLAHLQSVSGLSRFQTGEGLSPKRSGELGSRRSGDLAGSRGSPRNSPQVSPRPSGVSTLAVSVSRAPSVRLRSAWVARPAFELAPGDRIAPLSPPDLEDLDPTSEAAARARGSKAGGTPIGEYAPGDETGYSPACLRVFFDGFAAAQQGSISGGFDGAAALQMLLRRAGARTYLERYPAHATLYGADLWPAEAKRRWARSLRVSHQKVVSVEITGHKADLYTIITSAEGLTPPAGIIFAVGGTALVSDPAESQPV